MGFLQLPWLFIQPRWSLFFLFFVCFCDIPFGGYCKVTIEEFFNTFSGNWRLQISQLNNNSSNSGLFPIQLQSCLSPCVRHLYLTTRSDGIILQGSYMEFDQDEVVTNSLSLEFMGFPHNNSFKIFQDGLYLKDTNLSFKVSKSSVREEAFYIMSDSSISNRNISSLSCMGSVFKESMFWSCDDHIAWMIFGERLEEEEEEEKGGLRKYLPTIMIIVVFILVRKLQSFLLEKRATLVPTSFG